MGTVDSGFREGVTRGREEQRERERRRAHGRIRGGWRCGAWKGLGVGGGGLSLGQQDTPESLQSFKGKFLALTDRPLE